MIVIRPFTLAIDPITPQNLLEHIHVAGIRFNRALAIQEVILYRILWFLELYGAENNCGVAEKVY